VTEVFTEQLPARAADYLPGLGRHVEHDPRSRTYSVEDRLPAEVLTHALRSVIWGRHSPILDQGSLGACTGFALAGWFGCEPHCVSAADAAHFDADFARQRYHRATEVDRFAGTWPPEDTGSSGNAVCRAAKRDRLLDGYSWAFSPLGLLRALQRGPVIVGVPWYESFDQPNGAGEVRIGGQVVGGHEFLIRGADKQLVAPGGWWLHCDNSWGTGYGDGGSFRMSLETWGRLSAQRADVTVPDALG